MRRSIRPLAATAALLLALSVPATALGQAGAAARPSDEPGTTVAIGRTAHAGAKLARLAIAHARLAAHRPAALGAALPAGLTDPAPAVPIVAPAASTTPAADARPAVSITLGCTVVRRDGAASDSLLGPEYRVAVACRWSRPEDARVRAYKLWRIKDGGTRTLIAVVPASQPLRYLDTRVSFGHRYTYAVVGVKANGVAVAVSKPVTVRLPPGAETIRLGCALGAVDDKRGVICAWSEARHPAAAGYVLWRSVDGGARQAVHRTGLDGRRAFLDTDVRRGQVIRYAVVVVDEAGHPVGLGGPVVVRIPSPEPLPAATGDPAPTGAPAEPTP
ncbi:MAG: hypothetical protein ACLGIJ_02270 [Candidatus Limnocylindria bacterium]